MGVDKITKIIVREVTEKIVVNNKSGNKTYLIKNKEAYIVSTLEIDGAHGIPRDTATFTNELQQVIHDVGKLIIGNGIQPKSTQRYSCRAVQWVNRED